MSLDVSRPIREHKLGGLYTFSRQKSDHTPPGSGTLDCDHALKELEWRFGPLCIDVVEALHSADEAALVDVVPHVATNTMEQIRRR